MSKRSTRARLTAGAVLLATVAALSSAANASAGVRPHDFENCDGDRPACLHVTGNAGGWNAYAYFNDATQPARNGFFSVTGPGLNYTSQTQVWSKFNQTANLQGAGSGSLCADFFEGPYPDGHWDHNSHECAWIS
jgi:hypothetical protein